MKLIRDVQSLMGMLEGGELNDEASGQLAEVLQKLYELSNDRPKTSFKGEINIKIKLAVKDGMVEIDAELAPPKLPKLPRKTSVYWVVDGGRLSTEHPQQNDMFGGPREVDRSRPTPLTS
ncbi:hypothetical protein [Neorhizobium sp. DAR64872/K0K18]|jgi:hypothetical protein|uniref:hypothetical protein n=1 Tax=Neorhizobium sp. DAR64872/K0K18 TaxID=3421958 RepID=UPI003D2D4BCD